ncbi:MAG TPA: DUF4389 domain-containing protein [Gaiellales bacterium]|nr:DUF4389 domain-containing protein [Gaiellales bacterium]
MEPYPVTFSVDYPDRDLNRLTSAFRIFTAVPIVVIVATVSSAVFASLVLMLLFRKKYPRWWYDWNLELSRFTNRVGAYVLLMDDRYPSTDDHQSVHLQWPEVTGAELSRGLPLIKWLLAIPHYVVLFFLGIAAFFVTIYVWFAVLFTGRYPRGAFEFLEGVLRWTNRVSGYVYDLVTDRYPPFSLSP